MNRLFTQACDTVHAFVEHLSSTFAPMMTALNEAAMIFVAA